VSAHWAAEKALFGPAQGYVAFFYPPPYLLICLPLALVPYFWSLAVWLIAVSLLEPSTDRRLVWRVPAAPFPPAAPAGPVEVRSCAGFWTPG
jgi:hypothetical protein